MGRNCERCGAVIPEGAKFCMMCGDAAKDPPPAVSPAPAGCAAGSGAAPASAAPEEIPQDAKAAAAIQRRYRNRKLFQAAILSIPLLIYIIVMIAGEIDFIGDLGDFFRDGNIRDGFVMTMVAAAFILPYWLISEPVIRFLRRKAIREAGLDALRFKVALRLYKALKREGKTRPAADPGPISQEAMTAMEIQARYRRRNAAFLLSILLFLLLFTLALALLQDGFTDSIYMAIAMLALFASILIYFTVLIPVFRMRRRKAYRNAGFDEKRFLELLYRAKTLQKEKRQWQALSRQRGAAAAQAGAQVTAGAAKTAHGARVQTWIFITLAVAALGMALYVGGVFDGLGGDRTLKGVWVDTAGASVTQQKGSGAVAGVTLVGGAQIILFKPDGDAYFFQQGYAESEADVMRLGSHAKYKVSGKTITITKGSSKYTGTISGNTIRIFGKTFVPGKY